jgi:hypothetical protein
MPLLQSEGKDLGSQLQESSKLVKEVALALVEGLLQAIQGAKGAAQELLPGPGPEEVLQNVRLQLGKSLGNAVRRLELLVPLQVGGGAHAIVCCGVAW